MEIVAGSGLEVSLQERESRRRDAERGRELWGTVVTAAGAGMLGLSGMSLCGRICVTVGSEHRVRFAAQVSFLLLSIATSLLGIRAGTKKTVHSANQYLRLLLLFVAVSVAASVGISMTMERNWMHRHESHYPYQPSLPLVVLQGMANEMKSEGSLFGLLSHTQDKDDKDDKDIQPQIHDKNDNRTLSDIDDKDDTFNKGDRDESITFAAKSDKDETNMKKKKSDRDDKSDKDEKKPSSDKDDKDDRNELPYWTRQDIEDGMLLAGFILTIIVLSTGSCCLYCACSLLEFTKKYEQFTVSDSYIAVFQPAHPY